MIRNIAEKLDFPIETIEYLSEICNTLHENEAIQNKLYQAIGLFPSRAQEAYGLLQGIADETQVNRYSLDMVFLLLCARPLHDLYRQKGLPDALYYDSLMDLRYKLDECKKMHGVWGTFVVWWYPGFYDCTRFKLGRLQYERIPFPFDSHRGLIQKGDTVYNCHIPSSGPLRPQDVIDSLKKAYAFYRDELKDGILPVYCSSWMLYPPHAELYPKGSNLRAFYDLFEVISKSPDEKNGNFWRIFYKPFSPETLENAAEDTALQRNFKAYLKQGNSMGSGKAILLFDGNNII